MIVASPKSIKELVNIIDRHQKVLFAGCGTFTFPIAEKARVHAVERDKTALFAITAAARATLRPTAVEPVKNR